MNLKNKIKNLEDQQFSFFTGFLALYSIIFIRNIFESAFEDKQIFGFTSEIANSFYMLFVHYPLFYISIFVWLLLFLMLITKEDYNKIAKVLVIGFSVIIVVPFIDIIISRGSGYKLSYLTGFEEHPVAYKFFDFSRDMLQISWGQRIEILFAVLGLFGYVFIKTKRLWKSVFAAVIIYLIFFIHGLLPNAIAKIPSLFRINSIDYKTFIAGGILAIDSQNYSVIFCLSIFFAGFLMLKKINKGFYKEIINPKSSIIIIICMLLGVSFGVLLILPFYNFFIYSPIFYLIITLGIITIQLVVNSPLPQRFCLKKGVADLGLQKMPKISDDLCTASGATPEKRQNPQGEREVSPVSQLCVLAILFFSITISPIFLIFILLFCGVVAVAKYSSSPLRGEDRGKGVIVGKALFGTMNWATTILSLILAFLAGFSIIMQSATFKTIIPYNKQAIEVRGRRLSAWDNLLNGNYTQALSEYSIIYSLSGDNTILKGIGQCYLNLGEIDRAIENFNKIKTPDYQTIIYLSWAYSQQGKIEEVIEVYETGIKHNIEPADLYLKIAQIYAREGNEAKMADALQKALKYGAPKYQIYQIKGDYYLYQKNYQQALKMYEKSLFYNTRAPGPYVGKGKVLNILGDYKSALKEFKKALKFDPNSDAIYNNLGIIYIRLGIKEMAIKNFKKSIEINPAFAEGYFNLGLAYEKDNKLDSALVMYEKALKINPQFLPAKQAIERTKRNIPPPLSSSRGVTK